MNSAAYDIAMILDAAGVATFAATTGWALYVSRQPEKPDSTVTLYDTGGIALEGLCQQEIDRFTVQVRVRGNGYDDVYEKCQEIEREINGKKNEDIGTVHYESIWRNQPPQFLRFDEKDRPEIVQNFSGIRQET